MKNMLKAVACIAGASAMYAAVSGSEAYAQPGSRLCGWQTSAVTTKEGNKPLNDVHVAIVYEARKAEVAYDKTRKAEAAYDKKCVEAIKKIGKKLPRSIDIDVPVKGKTAKMTVLLTWKQVRKATCESVGANFDGQGVPKDICDKMGANHAYQWVKKSATEAATATKFD